MIRSKLIIKMSIITSIFISTAFISLFLFTYKSIETIPSLISILNKEYDEHELEKSINSEPILITDRNGYPLNTTYSTKWNKSDNLNIYEIPELIQKIFILSEDRSFYKHNGVDWRARIDALFQNIKAKKVVRGASTITEQVVRMIHPRKRTIWSRWIEGFEAYQLEKISSKKDILEFYLNQIPFSSNRRGIAQAARFYFDRTLSTLSIKEILALAILIRAPSAYNLYHYPRKIDKPLDRLAQRAIIQGVITKSQWDQVKNLPFEIKSSNLNVQAPHFIRHVYETLNKLNSFEPHTIKTTLDTALQSKAEKILFTALKNQKKHKVHDAALLIIKHSTGEIVAWVSTSTPTHTTNIAFQINKLANPISPTPSLLPNGDGNNNYSLPLERVGEGQNNYLKSYRYSVAQNWGKDIPSAKFIDAAKALRQPGSALKPFLYALALEKGWSAATIINDEPLDDAVGLGVHTYHNYSNIHYGPVTLRDALGNSLNIPAIKTIRFTGVEEYLKMLKKVGIKTLNRHPDFYGDGLALGNGEVRLYDMVQAYSVLANAGKFVPLICFYPSNFNANDSYGYEKINSHNFKYLDNIYLNSEQLVSEEVASIIGNILSDNGARTLEFGDNDLLNFPVQTAVKTGTSSDYRDSWAMGYNRYYTAGVWMGNLDGSPTIELSGSRGSAFVLRSIFAELNRIREQGSVDVVSYDSIANTSNANSVIAGGNHSDRGNSPLYMSPKLVKADVLVFKRKNSYDNKYIKKTEWFTSENQAQRFNQIKITNQRQNFKKFEFVNPVNGLEIAMDPRIPDELEHIDFKVTGLLPNYRVRWIINNKYFLNKNATLQWKIERGRHKASAQLIDKKDNIIGTDSVEFLVK
ncbi:MAG: transglycosylase domain-containing protein [Desulfamplus sp.]|nr:transglycosylase domain-containing protein [Desulfamplus sp.]